MTMTDERLHDHLRRTLRAVAATVTDDHHSPPAPTPRRPIRRSRRVALAAVAVAGTSGLGLVAWDRWEQGEIRRIPTEAALMEGTAASGGTWWLLPSSALHEVACPASVEFVSTERNRPGAEWNTGGVLYGEPDADPARPSCPDQSLWLRDPTRFELGSTSVGTSSDGWDENTDVGWFGTFHPSVVQLRVTLPSGHVSSVRTVPSPDEPDGPRFVAFTTPPDQSRGIRVTLLRADGSIVTERVTRT